MSNSLYVVIWAFEVKPESQADFENIYGPDGDWDLLFRYSSEYRGTQLLCDFNRPGRYFTLDYWASGEALREFKHAHKAEYDAYDERCEALTEKEFLIGEFTTLNSPTDK